MHHTDKEVQRLEKAVLLDRAEEATLRMSYAVFYVV